MNMLLVNTASEFTGQLRLLTIVVCVGFFMRLTADETPTVVYAVVNETARLPCPLPLLAPPRVGWFDLVYNTDRRPRKIFDGSGAEERSVDSKHPNGANYEVDANFTLFIGSVKLDDAGTYFCTSRQANYTLAKTYYLAVAGFPICRGTNPIAAGQSGQYSCECAFSGNYRPSLEWKREPNNTLTSADDFNVRLAREVFTFNASESDDGTIFTCRINFGSVDENCTINLTVFYPVRNVVIEPIKKSFRVGEEIRCSADGKPAPEITFEPVLSPGRTGLGWGSVTIPKSHGGRRTSIVCVASNVIDGKRLIARSRSFEISVESHSSVDGGEGGNNGNPAQSKSSSSTGSIVAGIVVGIMILVILVGIVFCVRLRKKRKPAKEENGGSKTSSSARAETKTPIKENQV